MSIEEPREKEVFEVTIERKETGKMCEDTVRFSKDCRKYRKRSLDYSYEYEFPAGSTVRLNGRELYVSEDGPSASCVKCVLAGPGLMYSEIFAGRMLCARSICLAGLRADKKNIHYRLKEEVKEDGSL